MGELPPSEKRRGEARRAGQVASSPAAIGAAGLCGAALAIAATGRGAAVRVGELGRRAFSGELPLGGALGEVGGVVAKVALPVCAAAFAAAALAGAAQTRGLFTLGAFGRRVRRDDEPLPLLGWAAAAALVLLFATAGRAALIALGRASGWRAAAAATLHALAALGPRALVVLAVAGAADWWLRRMRVETALKMTHAERRAEVRAEEGDPRLRAERRRRHRALAGSSLVDDVARAELVVAAEGVAVALRSDGDVPLVVAAGDRLAALRIVEIARRLGVPVRGDDLLAAALAELAPGDRVPPPFVARARGLLNARRR